MAFQNKNIAVLLYANGFTVWHYIANDAIEDVLDSGYFDEVCSQMNNGDVIYISCGGTVYIRAIKICQETVKLIKTE